MSIEMQVEEPVVNEFDITLTMRAAGDGSEEGSKLGIVVCDMELNIMAANAVAMTLLATDSIKGKRLDEVFCTDEARRKLRQQMERRADGEFGSYTVDLTRFDGSRLPVEIIGVPLKGPGNVYTRSLGIFRSRERDELATAIQELNLEVSRPKAKLDRLVGLLKPVLGFDAMTVSRYTADMRHLKTFYVHGLPRPAVAEKRWWPIDDKKREWIEHAGTSIIEDIQEFIESGPFQDMIGRPEVKNFLAMGFKASLRQDVRRDGKLVGALSFMSKRAKPFTSEQVALLDELPLEHVVVRAMDAEELDTLTDRLNLATTLNRCTSVQEACEALARAVVSMYGWAHVSVFRVDDIAQKLWPVALESREGGRHDISRFAPQPHTVGIVGRTTRVGQAQNIAEVTKDEDYKAIFPDIHSELSIPVRFAPDGPVRYIVNAEDHNSSAFSDAEVEEMQRLTSEFGTVVYQISELQSLAAAFENASDPIFVVDADRRVRRCNHAAIALAGREVKRGELMDDLFEDGAAFAAAVDKGHEDLGEMNLVSQDSDYSFMTPVYVSRKPQTDAGGAVLVVRDVKAIKLSVEQDVLSNSAYGIAVETSTALAVATAQLEGIMRRQGQDSVDITNLDRALRQLQRVRDSYVRLAAATGDTGISAEDFVVVDLAAEVDALIDDFPEEDRAKVVRNFAASQPDVLAAPFALRIVIASVLAPMIRCAVQGQKVKISIEERGRDLRLTIAGRLSPSVPGDAARAAIYESGAMGAVHAYVDRALRAMGGTPEVLTSPDGGEAHVFSFPRSSL